MIDLFPMRNHCRNVPGLLTSYGPWLLACWFIAIPSLLSANVTNHEDSLRKVLKTATDVNERIETCLLLANLVKARSADSSLLLLEEGLKLCWQQGTLEYPGRIFLLKGQLSEMKGNYNEALRQFKIAEFIFRKNGDKRRQAYALNWSGTLSDYNTPVNISESFRYRLKALRIAEEIKDTFLLAMIYNNLAGVFINSANYRSGIDYYKKAIKFWEATKDSGNMAIANLNLGSAYVNTDKVDSSRRCFETAIPIFRARNNQLYLQMCLLLLSYSSLKEKRYAEAENYADQAMNYVLTLGRDENHFLSKIVLSEIYHIKGRVSFAQGSYGVSRNYLLQGYRLLDSLGEFVRIRSLAEPLCESYEKIGRPDSANFFYKQVKMKSDSLLKNQISNFGKLAVVQMEYDREVREKQMQFLYGKKLQKRNLLIFAGSSVLLVSFVIILVLKLRLERQRKKREESEKKRAQLEKMQALLEKEASDVKLESQTREMTMNVMNLIRKNELMLEFSNRLLLIGNNTADERTGSEIMQLINSMEQNANNNVWEEFELRFNQVHNKYYERLLSRFPDLSPGDLKLSALLKLNLSTKEICELSGQRPSTLDMARYRLRKKLGLTPQDNLVTFLSQV